MIVAGIMSGTSADGINIALARITSNTGGRVPIRLRSGQVRPHTGNFHLSKLQFKLLGHAEYTYPKRVRNAVLSLMNAQQAGVADLARLNFLLAELYADAVLAAQRKFHVKVELIGCHGQTLYHQGEAASFLGRKLAVTWQTGDGSVLAARTGVPVVSDFRPADLAAGGKGAPLVPFLDYFFYRDPRVGRIVQNIGGIANLTAIPAGTSPEKVIAFDTGPGNMVMDAVAKQLFDRPFDRNGKFAAFGKVLEKVLAGLLRAPYFRRQPPKTAGREEFGREFVGRFLRVCGRADKRDVIATATAFTARSIGDSVKRFVLPHAKYAEFVVSGGGVRNITLMKMLGDELRPMGLKLRSSDEFGLPSEAKEAAAFALLAFQTWNRLPSNMPSATGAGRPAILGKISYV